ncbi:hypothetical protein T09_2858 [Trichinella sp. T9]|nr:hypothetical protein T09_2858 [Trichinella sp. T9]
MQLERRGLVCCNSLSALCMLSPIHKILGRVLKGNHSVLYHTLFFAKVAYQLTAEHVPEFYYEHVAGTILLARKETTRVNFGRNAKRHTATLCISSVHIVTRLRLDLIFSQKF